MTASFRSLAVVLALLCGHLAGAETCQPREEYDDIASTVTQRFYDQTFGGVDWPRMVERYRGEIECTDDESEVAVVSNKLLSELKASHTAVYTASDVDYWGLNSFFSKDLDEYETGFPGVWPEAQNGKWYVKYVLEGSAAARAGISPGDELISIEGKPFRPLGFVAGQSSLVISSDGVAQRNVLLHVTRRSVMRALVDASAASAAVLNAGRYKVGYFHLWAARDRILEKLNTSLARFEQDRIDALILDLRGGYGGTSVEYLARLRKGSALENVPKYFLVDDGVRSGKEMLAAIIKKDGLGTLVGSRTAGAFLGGVPVRLASGKYFVLVAAFGGTVPEVGPIEGVGVTPDILVSPCRVHCKGVDPQLETVLGLIKAKSQRS